MNTRATITIKGADDRAQIARWAQRIELGTVVTFRKKSRSTEQNAKLHAMLGEVSKQVEWVGQYLDLEDWKDIFTASLRHARVVPGIDKGTYVPLGMHTSTLTIEEMSNLIELIYAFGAEHGVVFKEPKETLESVSTPETGNADAPPQASAEGGDPQTSSPSSIADDELRMHLMDFARKGLRTAADEALGDKRADAIDDMTLEYRDAIPESDWGKLSTIKISLQAVLAGKRTIDQALAFLATDLLDCDPRLIGGEA